MVTRHTYAAGLSIPLYGEDKTKPAAQLKIEKVTLGAQKLGVFRVAVLPQLTGWNAEIVFSGNKVDPEALRDLCSALEVLVKTDAAEFYGLSVRTAGSSEPEFRAERARISAGRDWQLTQVVTKEGRTAAKARLAIEGNSPGQLIFQEKTKSKPTEP